MIRNLFILLLGLILYWSCEDYIAEPDNPLDPDNPEYISPETTILSGPQDGETVDNSSVTFTWQGNDQAVEYSYSLNSGWSDWSSEISVTLDYLDEGDYFFQVKSRYTTEDEDDTPAGKNFTVDAVHGPALRIYPLQVKTVVSQPRTVEVYMEEVENIMATEFTVSYNSLLVTVESVTKGALLDDFNGESVLIFETNEEGGNGTITFDLGVAIGDDFGITGSGSVAIIEFMPVSIGDFDIEISVESTFRDHNNMKIPLNQIVNGRFEVE